jgi:hypothetical protein
VLAVVVRLLLSLLVLKSDRCLGGWLLTCAVCAGLVLYGRVGMFDLWFGTLLRKPFGAPLHDQAPRLGCSPGTGGGSSEAPNTHYQPLGEALAQGGNLGARLWE